MDAGIAAVIAGAVGVLGAGGGAWLGARTAARAMERHGLQQWLRQQRLDAYVLFLDAYNAYNNVVGRLLQRAEAGAIGLSSDDRRQVHEVELSAIRVGIRVALVGSNEVRDARANLLEKILEYDHTVRAWGGSLTADERRRHVANLISRTEQLAETHADFVRAARAELAELEHPSSPQRSLFSKWCDEVRSSAKT
ncbi:hypothetical protein ACFY97_13170 [Streptomyces klenkii]|uniref:hypothetical protein n=1 Tax=Streptomyces klenkii TaxID=1420899 RepID=UPI0036E0FE0B